MKFTFVGCTAGLILALLSQGTKAADEYVEEIEVSIKAIKGVLDAKLTASELKISKEIVVQVPNTLPFTDVGAYHNHGTRFMAVNVGTVIRLQELSRAILIDSKIVHDQRYLMGYLRYLAYSDQFGGKFLTADQFAAHYLGSQFQQRFNDLSQADLQTGQNIFMNALAFVVAHEIAHHVLGHLEDPDQSGGGKQLREELADKWAASVIFRTGFTPMSPVFTMLMFNEAYERTDRVTANSTHPAPISRAISLSKNSVLLLEQSLQPNPPFSSLFDRKNLEVLLAGARKLNDMVVAHSSTQGDLSNTLKLKAAAGNGIRHSQLRMGELYSNGKNKDFPYDLERARIWYRFAAENPAKFDYLDQADANNRVGWMYGYMPTKLATDFPLACHYLKRSAEVSYSAGVWAYEKLFKEGKCDLAGS